MGVLQRPIVCGNRKNRMIWADECDRYFFLITMTHHWWFFSRLLLIHSSTQNIYFVSLFVCTAYTFRHTHYRSIFILPKFNWSFCSHLLVLRILFAAISLGAISILKKGENVRRNTKSEWQTINEKLFIFLFLFPSTPIWYMQIFTRSNMFT